MCLMRAQSIWGSIRGPLRLGRKLAICLSHLAHSPITCTDPLQAATVITPRDLWLWWWTGETHEPPEQEAPFMPMYISPVWILKASFVFFKKTKKAQFVEGGFFFPTWSPNDSNFNVCVFDCTVVIPPEITTPMTYSKPQNSFPSAQQFPSPFQVLATEGELMQKGFALSKHCTCCKW